MVKITVARNTVRVPRGLRLYRDHYRHMIQTIERDIHRHVERGLDIEDRPQKANKESTRKFKQTRGLPQTPLMMGWRPFGYHRFTSRFRRDFGQGWAVLALHRSPAPGGFSSQRDVAGYVERLGYRVPFGISMHAAKVLSVYIYRELQKAVMRRANRRRI